MKGCKHFATTVALPLPFVGLDRWEMQCDSAGQAPGLISTFRHVAAVASALHQADDQSPLLSEQEFATYFEAPTQDATAEAASVVDIRSYVDDLAPGTLGIATIGDVHCIY